MKNVAREVREFYISSTHGTHPVRVSARVGIYVCVCVIGQWRRSVVKYGDQGQSGQAIKLFQITPYVNDFQTLNNPGS